MADKKLVLKISGMRCDGCSGRVKGALEMISGVESAVVDHSTGKAEVAVTGDVSTDKLVETVSNLGYTATAE